MIFKKNVPSYPVNICEHDCERVGNKAVAWMFLWSYHALSTYRLEDKSFYMDRAVVSLSVSCIFNTEKGTNRHLDFNKLFMAKSSVAFLWIVK
jgi:hypothetical protein